MSTSTKTPKKENLPVLRVEFELLTVLKPELLTKKGTLRKSAEAGLAKYIQFEAHKFIDAHSPADIMANSTIEIEEVEVLDETNG